MKRNWSRRVMQHKTAVDLLRFSRFEATAHTFFVGDALLHARSLQHAFCCCTGVFSTKRKRLIVRQLFSLFNVLWCHQSFFVQWEEYGKTIDGRVLECLGFARVCTSGELQVCSLFWTFQVCSWTTNMEDSPTHSIRSAMRGSAVPARESNGEATVDCRGTAIFSEKPKSNSLKTKN